MRSRKDARARGDADLRFRPDLRVVGTYRFELRAIGLMVRYLPVFVGVVLAASFTMSVLCDSPDIAKAAWRAGADLVGLYGGFGVIALPGIFAATSRWRRGKPCAVTWAGLLSDDLVIDFTRRRSVHIPAERIRSAYAYPLQSGRARLSLELAGGLNDGDRIDLELDADFAEPIVRRFAANASLFDLAREGASVGAVIHALAIALGAITSSVAMGRIEAAAATWPFDPTATSPSTFGWSLGLGVAAAGFFHGALSLAVSPPSVAVGVDGIRVEGLLRRRFIPFTSITNVRESRWGIALELTAGGVLRVFAPGAGDARLGALVSAIRARLGQVDTAHAPLSARCTGVPRSVQEWRDAIDQRQNAASYRAMGASDEDLASSLMAPDTPREARLAAAATLATRRGPWARLKIRVAAESIAEDTTRALLERLAEDEADLESLDAAMGAPNVTRSPIG